MATLNNQSAAAIGERPPAASVSERGSDGADGGPSLDQRTSFDEDLGNKLKAFNFKKLSYPDGSAEIVATPKRSKRFRAKMQLIDEETGEIIEPDRPELSALDLMEKRQKSLNRTKTSIRRAIMGMGATHMLTLTYRENMTDLRRGWQDLSRFLRAMRDALDGYDYVVVAEEQKRGAWHFHLAVRGKQDLKLIRKLWTHGNPDVQRWNGRVAQMAAYMSKYLMKSFWHRTEADRHRYRRSQGIAPRPVVITVEAGCSKDVKHIMRVLFQEDGLIGFAHCEGGEGTAGHYVWGCTWLDEPPDDE